MLESSFFSAKLLPYAVMYVVAPVDLDMTSGKSYCVNYKSQDFCLHFKFQEASPVLRMYSCCCGTFGLCTWKARVYMLYIDVPELSGSVCESAFQTQEV